MFVTHMSGQQMLGQASQSHDTQCITEEQHEFLISEIKIASQALRKQPQNKTTKSIVLFDWPLRAKPSLDFYNYYSTIGYVDHDPAVGSGDFNLFGDTNLDYNCGNNTYDRSNDYNHQGTDIVIWPFPWYLMENDLVEVIAAQAGTIVIKGDGNFDENCGSIPTGSLTSNRIVIEHADNSRSIYLHFKNGSITSKPIGSTVAKGEYLGVVGSSGYSALPHLHFEIIDQNFNVIDPYSGPCNSSNTTSWWANQPAYSQPQINAIITHSSQPVLNECPASTEQLNRTDCYIDGEQLALGIYWRDMVLDMNTSIVVKDPANNTYLTTGHNGIGTYRYYWWGFDLGFLPSGGPYGNWTIEATFNGQLYSHNFHYAASLSTSPCENCTEYITESGNYPITQNVSATINITTDGNIASGLSIDYHAGQSLDLLSGFSVTQGAVFHGYIAPCF